MNENFTTINNFSDAINLIDQFSKKTGFVFRGQSTGSWKLKPSIFRCAENYVAVQDHLEKFKKYSVGRIENIEIYSEKELWAIGQHFGLNTPLLDWTVSAAIALYFAFEGQIENNEDYASFYALNAKEINKEFCRRILNRQREVSPESVSGIAQSSIEMNGKLLIDMFEKNPNLDEKLVELDVEADFIRIFSPKRFNNQRILAQRGLFSFTHTGKPIEDILSINGLPNLCEKYLLNIRLKNEIIKYLDAHNVNPMSLYPDISGAAMYTNLKIFRYDIEEQSERQTDFWL